MNLYAIILSFAAYIAVIIFITGFIGRLVTYFRTPAPLRIPLTPAPKTYFGALMRLFGNAIFFYPLLRKSKFLWLYGYVFHVSFFLVIMRHLRYFLYPVPEWVMSFQSLGVYAGYSLALSILFLFARRMFSDRDVYISLTEDYFALFLLLIIAGTGLLMHYYYRPYLVDIKSFSLGLTTFDWSAPSTDLLFIIHLLSVMLLVIYFPFGKLLHSGAIWFSPTIGKPDDISVRKYKNPWDKV
ncbi:MAG: sulfite reduction-associated complex DsrMKJOP protein DsrM [Ignavibacteria bacterium]|nr:sulfite reduction-associated complex DsrMKJOP protein DsrM [Ignavibacteria bacterium]